MHFEHCTLYSTKIEALKQFYSDTLGWPLENQAENHFTVRVGRGWLTFQKAETQPPPYHFAVNISENKIHSAIEWMKAQNVELLDSGEPETPLMPFPSWNADSVYFNDSDNNIVEFIARHRLSGSKHKVFETTDILEISELGLPCRSVSSMAENLENSCGLERWSGDFNVFGALGDEHGLFIIVDTEKKTWIPTETPAHGAPFVARIKNNQRRFKIRYDGHNIEILNVHQAL